MPILQMKKSRINDVNYLTQDHPINKFMMWRTNSIPDLIPKLDSKHQTKFPCVSVPKALTSLSCSQYRVKPEISLVGTSCFHESFIIFFKRSFIHAEQVN